MLTQKNRILYSPAGEDDNGGGGTGYEDDSKDTSADDKGSEDAGGDTDDYGYPKEEPGRADSTPGPDDKSKQKSSTEPDLTGYGDDKKDDKKVEDDDKKEEPAKGDDKKPDDQKKDDTKKDDESSKLEIDFLDLPDQDKNTIGEFAKTHKLSKEAATALVALRKDDLGKLESIRANLDKNIATETAKIHAKWNKDLRDDPVFGGANFSHSVQAANKIFSEMFVNTKKELTGKGTVLPAYLMKDLLALSKRAYSSSKGLPKGEATIPDNDDDASSHLDFYET